jgi:RimJ/RimL family protein N-acetyltransferase
VEAVEVELRDGSRVRVRPIEPDDRDALAAAFERLSDRSRYRRFLAATPRLTSTVLTYLTGVDHHDHEALVAFDEESGDIVAVGRFVREEDDDAAAEAAITVADDWQGRGLGTRLLELISERAREERIERFTATLLAENREMLDLFDRLGPVRVVDRREGTIEIVAEIPPEGTGIDLREALRVAARELLQLARPLGARRPPPARGR